MTTFFAMLLIVFLGLVTFLLVGMALMLVAKLLILWCDWLDDWFGW